MRHSLRTRLNVSFILLAIGPLVLVGSLLSWQNYRRQKQQAIDFQSEVALRVAEQVETFITAIEEDLVFASRFQNAAGQLETTFVDMVMQLPASNKALETLHVFDPAGNELLHVTRLGLVADPEPPVLVQRPEYVVPLTTGRRYYSQVWLLPQASEPLMTIGLPLYDLRTGSTIGVLVADVRIKQIWDLIAGVPLAQGESIYIVDANNSVVAHQNPSVVLRGTSYEAPSTAGIYTGLNGEPALIAVSAVSFGQQQLSVVVEKRLSDALALTYQTLSITTLVTLLALALAITLGVLAVRSIVQPVEDLAATARAIQAGDLTSRAVVSGEDELGQLAGSFNDMTQRLRESLEDMARKVAELEQTQAALRASEERYRELFENANDIVYTHDLAGHFTSLNRAAERVSGYSREEALQLSLGNIVTPESLPVAQGMLARKLSGGGVTTYVLEMRAKDGRIVPLEVSTRLIYRDGQPVGVQGIARDISERQEAMAALRRSEERFRQLAENINQVFWITDIDGQLIYVSPAYERIWQRTAASLYQTPGGWREAIHPEDRAGVDAACPQARTENGYDIEYRVVRPNGDIVWVRDRAFPIRNVAGDVYRIAGIAEDITARKASEEALRRSEATNRALLEALPDIMFRISADGYLLDMRLSALRNEMLPPPEQMIGRHINELAEMFEEDLLALAQRFVRAVDRVQRTGEVETLEYQQPAPEREGGYLAREARFIAAPRGELLIMIRDVTERKQAEEAQQQAQRLESIGLLAGGIAHDFNNLLTGMLGQASLARLKLPPDSPAQAHIAKAVKSAERAADLTRQLLAYAGKGQFQVAPITLNELLLENVALLETVLPKQAALALDLAPELAVIEADRVQIQQVVMNLVINAAEALQGQPGRVTVSTYEQHVRRPDEGPYAGGTSLTPGRYVTLQVSDTGIGMDLVTQDRIFDPFFSTKTRGRGLGLSATLGIIRTHQGAIRLQSEPGLGTTITVWFPVVEAQPEPEADDSAPTGPMSGVVLVIDDELPVREAVGDILEMAGLKVVMAANGREGVACFQEHQATIGLALVDLQMPVMDGQTTVRALRQIDDRLPIILSSGYSQGDVSEDISELEVSSFLQKPYDVAQLLAEVKRVLNGR